jgi:hypothetical protein
MPDYREEKEKKDDSVKIGTGFAATASARE